jgi:hypothetical protein
VMGQRDNVQLLWIIREIDMHINGFCHSAGRDRTRNLDALQGQDRYRECLQQRRPPYPEPHA